MIVRYDLQISVALPVNRRLFAFGIEKTQSNLLLFLFYLTGIIMSSLANKIGPGLNIDKNTTKEQVS